MFVVTEAEATVIRNAFEQRGELSAAIELRRLFPGVTDIARARDCARTIAGRKPLPVPLAPRCRDCARRSALEARRKRPVIEVRLPLREVRLSDPNSATVGKAAGRLSLVVWVAPVEVGRSAAAASLRPRHHGHRAAQRLPHSTRRVRSGPISGALASG